VSGFRGEAVSWSLQRDVLEVELHRLPCNEIGSKTLDELEILARSLQRGDHGARALLLYSSLESGFSAGADLKELYRGLSDRAKAPGWVASIPSRRGRNLVGRALSRAGRPLVEREIRAFIDRIHAVFDAIDQAPLTTVAAVHRVVFGGGFELALTADVVVADPSARFCLPELRLGIIPGFGAIPRLRRDAGNPAIRDLLLTGRSLGARRAWELGLVSHLSAGGKSLDLARSVARQAAKLDPDAVRAAKSLAKPLPREELDREKALFCALATSPVTRAALEKFANDTSTSPYLP
jgi:enoyl-CoA hydratase/carnithine racemase